MRLMIREDPEAACRFVAEYIIDRINAFAPSPERPFVLGLPTGSSPLGIYRNLVTAHRDGRISFANVTTFNMDEYVGLPRDHPASYHTFMFKHLFGQVDIDPANVHIPDGSNPRGLEEECRSYEAKMAALGGVELFLGGVGGDGHIAFNEPGSSLASRTRVKSLTPETVRANARFFEGGQAHLVPTMALTVGVQTIMDAREVVIIATGPGKARAVQEAVEGGVSHLCTLSCLQMHPRSMIVVDEEATVEMKVKTVNYFKGVERSIKQAQVGAGSSTQGLMTKLPPLNTNVPEKLGSDDVGELTPDSMGSRLRDYGRIVRSATIPFALASQQVHS